VAVPGLFVGLVFVAASLVRHSQTERRQRWIRQVFSRYVSPNLVDYLVEHAITWSSTPIRSNWVASGAIAVSCSPTWPAIPP